MKGKTNNERQSLFARSNGEKEKKKEGRLKSRKQRVRKTDTKTEPTKTRQVTKKQEIELKIWS